MTISLKIDNFDALPDGGPLTYQAHRRGFEIGREHRDWTLPDPNMFISGRHCEVRFEKGGYWLYDVSRNGTFLNGSQQRIKSPHLPGQWRPPPDRALSGRRLGRLSRRSGRGRCSPFVARAEKRRQHLGHRRAGAAADQPARSDAAAKARPAQRRFRRTPSRTAAGADSRCLC